MKAKFGWGSMTSILVVSFLLILLLSLSHESKSEPYVELGHSYNQTSSVLGGFGYVYRSKYDVHLGILGHGDSSGGIQDTQYFGSLSRIVSPKWEVVGFSIKPRIGIAYTEGIMVCKEYSYRLGLLFERNTFTIEITHYSNAGLFKENSGLDGITIKVPL